MLSESRQQEVIGNHRAYVVYKLGIILARYSEVVRHNITRIEDLWTVILDASAAHGPPIKNRLGQQP